MGFSPMPRSPTRKRDAEGWFQCTFDLGEQLRSRSDSIELESFGFDDEHSQQGTLCCRWRVGLIREVHIQSHLVGGGASKMKFGWLEKATRPAASERVKAALTMDRSMPEFANRVGGREADPWVPANREFDSLFARRHPPKSDARFFQQLSRGTGEERLELLNWFRAQVLKHNGHQVVIFDPYFEDAGLGLLLLCAQQNANCLVFRSLPKPSEPSQPGADKSNSVGLDNLLANCGQNRDRLRRINLQIYGLKHGRLHDRYILFIAPDGLPAAGFHLSNSFQHAAENYPFLVTSIPADVLFKVEEYKSQLLREAGAARLGDDAENLHIRLLFDSKASPISPPRFELLRFLDKAQAGDVLSLWTGQTSLQGLSGDPLRERMATLGLIGNQTLTLPLTASLSNFLAQHGGDFTSFTATWDVLGEVLAHSNPDAKTLGDVEFKNDFLEFLARFLEAAFDRTHDETSKELEVIRAHLFRDPIEKLLYSAFRSDHLFHLTKYAGLTWSELFAVRLLWERSPNRLLSIAEAEMRKVPAEVQIQDGVRLSLLSQITSEISLSAEFSISEAQRDRLIRSGSGLLYWMGLNALERQLGTPEGSQATLNVIATFAYPEQVRVLGWMIQRVAKQTETAATYSALIAALHKALPTPISKDDLKGMVDSMRGHMRQLVYTEPWLSQDVLFPLFENQRANIDDACEIWINELVGLLDGSFTPRLFERTRQGRVTLIAAFLFAYSSPERQRMSLTVIERILKRQQRIVQQPLANASNWTRWDDALVVSMWVLIFTKWALYYLQQRGMADSELESLSRGASELAMRRSMNEWQSKMTGNNQGELAAALDDVEELLDSSDD
jgi:hypothetical protein